MSVIPHMQSQLRVSGDFLKTVSALGIARIAILVLMVVTFVTGKLQWTTKQAESEPEERQSLLQNGHFAGQNYDGTRPKVDISSGSSQRTQVSGTGWLDYLAGFKILFPYLWYVVLLHCRSIKSADYPKGQKTRLFTKLWLSWRSYSSSANAL